MQQNHVDCGSHAWQHFLVLALPSQPAFHRGNGVESYFVGILKSEVIRKPSFLNKVILSCLSLTIAALGVKLPPLLLTSGRHCWLLQLLVCYHYRGKAS